LWSADPVAAENSGDKNHKNDKNDDPLAFKYFGYCEASNQVRAEYQVVPMLTALFWEVERSVIYKPSPPLRGVARSLAMKQRTRDVLGALRAFEDEFANLILHDPLTKRRKPHSTDAHTETPPPKTAQG
jgi:hypothetical protein